MSDWASERVKGHKERGTNMTCVGLTEYLEVVCPTSDDKGGDG
jgi:hypothetical protein